jgi:AcrR family transcriptional regulator
MVTQFDETPPRRRGTRKEQKLATRKALKDTARVRFQIDGYEAAQINDITADAGVAKGTFYVHFPDKAALADELLADFNAGFAERLLPVLQKRSNRELEKTIALAAEVFLDYWKENRGFVGAYAEKSMAGLDLNQLQSGVNPPMQDAVGHALAQFAAEQGLNIAAPDLVIQGLLSLWLRLGLQFLFNPAVSRAQVLKTLVAMTTGAVRAVMSPLPSSSRTR